MARKSRPDASEFLLERIQQELLKSDEKIDWDFIEHSLDMVIENDGKTDGAPLPDMDESLRELMAAARRIEPQTEEKPSAKTKKPVKRALFLVACLAVILAVGTYADIRGRVSKHPEAHVYTVEFRDLDEDNYVKTDWQTDSPLYQELATLGIKGAVLPDTPLLDGYDASIEVLLYEEHPTAAVHYSQGERYVDITIANMEAANGINIMRNIRYTRKEEFDNNGIHFIQNVEEVDGDSYISAYFRVNQCLYEVKTNGSWDDTRAMLLSLH